MGIPKFVGAYLNKRFPGAKVYRLPKSISSLSIDMNSTFHKVAGTTYGYGEKVSEKEKEEISKKSKEELDKNFLENLVKEIEEIVRTFRPEEVLILAVDGVAPFAKILQQRQRRYRGAAERGAGGGEGFDTTSITPGTEFMLSLNDYLRRWILANQNKEIFPRKIVYSSCLVPGEGEHKIYEIFRTNPEFKDQQKNHVVYGLDADLIMLSLLSPVENIFLSRENKADIFSIKILRERINSYLISPTSVQDFVLVCSMLGNDFLPHYVTYEELKKTLDVMFDVYKKGTRFDQTPFQLTVYNSGEIDWTNLSYYIVKLAQREKDLVTAFSKETLKYPYPAIEESFVSKKFDFDKFRENWYLFAESSDYVQDMVESFLSTLGWIFKYYNYGTKGICPTFCYRYNYSPLWSEIASILGNTEIVLDRYDRDPEIDIDITIFEQLCSVVPLSSYSLLPNKILAAITPLQDSQIVDAFPVSFKIRREGTNSEHISTAIISPPPYNRLHSFLSVVMKNPEEKYNEENNFIQTKSDQLIEEIKRRRELSKTLKKLKEEAAYKQNLPAGLQGLDFDERGQEDDILSELPEIFRHGKSRDKVIRYYGPDKWETLPVFFANDEDADKNPKPWEGGTEAAEPEEEEESEGEGEPEGPEGQEEPKPEEPEEQEEEFEIDPEIEYGYYVLLEQVRVGIRDYILNRILNNVYEINNIVGRFFLEYINERSVGPITGTPSDNIIDKLCQEVNQQTKIRISGSKDLTKEQLAPILGPLSIDSPPSIPLPTITLDKTIIPKKNVLAIQGSWFTDDSGNFLKKGGKATFPKPRNQTPDDGDVVLMYLRNTAGILNTTGLWWALPNKLYDTLKTKYNFTLELYANPMNCHLERFCSLHSDIDEPFGSIGRVQSINLSEIEDTNITCNPPYTETSINYALNKVMKEGRQDQTFLIMIPDWADMPTVKKIKALAGQEGTILLEKKKHFVENVYGERIVAQFTTVVLVVNKSKDLKLVKAIADDVRSTMGV